LKLECSAFNQSGERLDSERCLARLALFTLARNPKAIVIPAFCVDKPPVNLESAMIQYTTKMIIICDNNRCLMTECYSSDQRVDGEFYKIANEYFRKCGWVLHRKKNYCAGCAVDVAARIHNRKNVW
jgi:hypothetical protein